MENEYKEYCNSLGQECFFCPVSSDNKIKKEYRYWRMIYNKFKERHPEWDKAYVLVLKRHLENHKRKDLLKHEKKELLKIIEEKENYSIVHKGKDQCSVNHMHIHFVLYK